MASAARSSSPTTAARTARRISPGAKAPASSRPASAATGPPCSAASPPPAAATSSWAMPTTPTTSPPLGPVPGPASGTATTWSWATASRAASGPAPCRCLHRYFGNPVLTGDRSTSSSTPRSATSHCGLRGFAQGRLRPARTCTTPGHGVRQRDGRQGGPAACQKISEVPTVALSRWPRAGRRTCAASGTAGAACASC